MPLKSYNSLCVVWYMNLSAGNFPTAREREKETEETLRIELTKNGIKERKRERGRVKEKTKRQQTIISVPLNAQNHLAKPKRKRAGKEATGNWQQKEVGDAPHKVLETVFQALDSKVKTKLDRE